MRKVKKSISSGMDIASMFEILHPDMQTKIRRWTDPVNEFYMTIGGKRTTSNNTFAVINPATEEVFAQAPSCTAAQLDLAVEAASQAFAGWREDESSRRQALKNSASAMRAHVEELAELFTREQGRTLKATRGEIEWSAWWIDKVADMEIPHDLLVDDSRKRVEVRRKPRGVVGAITPWNFPMVLAISKIAPSLLLGNTMVLKPSPYTPLTTLRLGELLLDALPPGVLNIVSGSDELGAWMTKHPGINMITFTGSVNTGKKVAQSTAPELKRAVLELGGNDAAIVLPDVDPKEIAKEIFDGAFAACGQICFAIKRLYLHETIFDDMVAELKRLATNIRIGDGMEEDTEMGPINNLPQLERIIELTADARQHGAEIVTGGKRLERPGYFFPPTIVTGINDGIRLVDEEQFGPVLPVMSFTDVDDAIARANGTGFGLGGSIWTNDIDRGIELAARLECGTAWINRHGSFAPDIPFGGAKLSGIGIQNGTFGLDELSQLQVIYLDK
jgi:acyl-CoA reductase-like NAD-dependent aldehyde dehydrogenase